MSIIEKQVQLGRELFEINAATMRRLFELQSEGVKRYFETNQEFAAKYGVRNIPTVLVFNNGELVGRQVCVAPKNVYSEALDSLLN